MEPEILDALPAADPEARRSRRDLRTLNLLMGNHRWLLREVRRHPRAALRGVVELGAGEGFLADSIARRSPVTAVDLAPRPPGLAERIEWLAGDVFSRLDDLHGGMLVANLFLHHFGERELGMLGRLAARFEVLAVCEPWRVPLATWLGRLMHPWINRVTRHDMHASIRAGFRRGELAGLLGLDGGDRVLVESVDPRGAIRLVSRRAS